MLSAFHIRLKMKNLCITITFLKMSIIVVEVNSTMWLKKQNSTYFCIEPNVHTSTSRLRRNATSHFNETLQFIHFKNAALTLLCYTLSHKRRVAKMVLIGIFCLLICQCIHANMI